MRFHDRRRDAVSALAACGALFLVLHFGAGGQLLPVGASAVKAVLSRPETAAVLAGGELTEPAAEPTPTAVPSPAPTPSPTVSAAVQETAVPTPAPTVTPQLLFFAAPIETAAVSVPEIENHTDHDIDAAALLAGTPEDYTGTVLIVHTHTSESYYTGAESAGDSFRTDDTTRNVVRVGEELKNVLTARGISVIHDKTVHDVPYTGAYTRALETVEGEVASHPEISVVIDLHRDAFSDGVGGTGRTVCTVNGKDCAQVLLVMGSDACGLEHPNWQKNLALGLRLQSKMDTDYPGLARKLYVSENRYNQHITDGSMILEVGCTGNTLEEALLAAHCFGDVCADVLLGVQ